MNTPQKKKRVWIPIVLVLLFALFFPEIMKKINSKSTNTQKKPQTKVVKKVQQEIMVGKIKYAKPIISNERLRLFFLLIDINGKDVVLEIIHDKVPMQAYSLKFRKGKWVKFTVKEKLTLKTTHTNPYPFDNSYFYYISDNDIDTFSPQEDNNTKKDNQTKPEKGVNP